MKSSEGFVEDTENIDRIKQKGDRKWIITVFTLIVSAIVSQILHYTDFIVDLSMQFTENSPVVEIWKNPQIPIFTKVYIFNVTNYEQFLTNQDHKLKLQQLGPYVYREYVTNNDLIFNDNDTVTYRPKRRVVFQPKLSINDPKTQRVMVPNIAFLGLASMLAESNLITNVGLLSLSKMLDSQPFLNLTIDEYLWGYDDPLIKMAHTVISNWIPFKKLGILDRMFDEGENIINMHLKDNGLPVTDPAFLPKYSINTWNYSPGLPVWGYKKSLYDDREEPLRPQPNEKCHFIRGATEGLIYPRNINPALRFYVYRKVFCRTTPVEFKHEGTFLPGIKGFWYGLPDNVFDTPYNNLEQFCYCNPLVDKCLPKGLSDITPCYYNIPAAVSPPHFYNADPSLLDKFEGLYPNKDDHDSHAVLQPTIGTVLNVTSRIQTNLIIREIKYNAKLLPLSNTVLPLFWVEMVMGNQPISMMITLYMLVLVVPCIHIATTILGLLASVYLVVVILRKLLATKRKARDNPTLVRKLSHFKLNPM